MPLRKLFKSIPELLLTLKPCLMMSPLSVAYFLDAESYKFDMVIFDEASQIFPQDAIGAIMRGKQVIIAGDTKQLPPTSFFSASTGNNNGYDDDEGYEEVYEEEIYDSILEETANILPNRTLLWHYRSKHEHLIAFSNNQIYKNELITFPSSNESEPDTGVEYIYVENGYYEPSPKNHNAVEAKRIVELVKEHIEKHPKRSLGIIAFSEKQQQIISSEIQRFREANPEYESFFAEEIDDEFFVKNLENVQGDERDTIIFSIGYAKTMEQKKNNRPMSMRFGPLGLAGGERRLNVAITRAKINVKLVGSIMPSDIDLSRTKSDGVKMLRSYIEYAMNTDVALAGAAKQSRQDEFVDVIADYIRKHGYKVRQYVGCSGYKIDIAVQHPSELVEQFVAGIECDGYSYISAKTVRDRDRLRSSVLENMGWNLYRLWSAEWYKNPETEGKRLLSFIKDAIGKCDEKVRRIEELKRKEEADKKAELERLRSQRKAEELRKQSAKAKSVQKPAVKKADPLEKAKKEFSKREAELSKPQQKTENTDLSWVRPGARVTHKRYGNGIITEFIKDKNFVKIRFSTTESLFAYPYSFENGTISRYVNQPAIPEKQPVTLAKVGEKVEHKTFGEGIVEKIENGHIEVKFGDITKIFQYPLAFHNGFLVRVKSDSSVDEKKPLEIRKLAPSNSDNTDSYGKNDDLDDRSEAIKDPHIISQIVMYYVNSNRWRDYLMFVLGINLGLKAKVFLQLRYGDLVDESGIIKDRVLISEQTERYTNKKRQYYVVLNSVVKEALNLYIKHSEKFNLTDYLFRSESSNGKDLNRQLSVNSLDRVLKGTVNKMNLDIRISTATLRKTFAFHHLILAKDAKYQYVVANVLHYRTLADLFRYIGTTEDEIRSARKTIVSAENYYFNGGVIVEV